MSHIDSQGVVRHVKGSDRANSVRFGCVITDAKEDYVVRVRKSDCKGAVCRDHQKCVIAKALQRQRGKSSNWVDVGCSIVLVQDGQGKALRYTLNSLARAQVRFFDEKGHFAPCNITLNAPVESAKMGKYKGKYKRGSNKRKLPRFLRSAPSR